jgi:hypothetical protein
MVIPKRLLSALAVLAAACAPADGGEGRQIETDSAGVRIITSIAPVWGDSARWRVSGKPEVEIGAVAGTAPEYLFSSAHSAMRLSDGRIAVADMGSAEVRYYDSQGRFLRRTGRRGQGPGEWAQLYSMRRGGGDSIQVVSPPNRHSIISPAGEFVRRFSLDPVRDRPNIWAIGRLASGPMLAFSLAAAGDRVAVPREAARGEEARLERDTATRPDGFYREQYMHFLYTPEGDLIDSIGILPGGQEFGGSGQGAFLARGHYAMRGDSMYFGPGDQPEVRVYALWRTDSAAAARIATLAEMSDARAGMTLQRIIRRQSADSSLVTPGIIEAYRARERVVLTRAFRDAPGFSVERAIAEIRFPDRLPAQARILVDAAGAVWMQEYVVPGMEDSVTTWTVFDERDRWLGRMQLPARLQVTDIGTDYVFGIWRNDEDVQFIRKYGLDRGGARQ